MYKSSHLSFFQFSFEGGEIKIIFSHLHLLFHSKEIPPFDLERDGKKLSSFKDLQRGETRPFRSDNQLSWTQNYYELQKFNRANTL